MKLIGWTPNEYLTLLSLAPTLCLLISNLAHFSRSCAETNESLLPMHSNTVKTRLIWKTGFAKIIWTKIVSFHTRIPAQYHCVLTLIDSNILLFSSFSDFQYLPCPIFRQGFLHVIFPSLFAPSLPLLSKVTFYVKKSYLCCYFTDWLLFLN